MQVDLVKRHEAKITIVCMALLALAAGYLLLTRPTHRVEGDFLEREDRRVVDEWLLSQLQVTIAEQRARAYLALGRIGDPATLPHLLDALNDPAPSVRAAAAFAIGVMEDADAPASLSREPRREAADALRPLLEDDERAVVANAVEALGKLGFADLSERLTQTAAPHPVTLTALVRLRAVELAPWIAERLKSDDQDNRWAAALALNALNCPLDEGLTRSFLNLTKDREVLVRIEVVRGLGRTSPSAEIVEALVRMSSDPDAKVRMAALGSLGALGQPGTLEILVGSLRDRNENVAAAGIRAIAKLGDRRAVPILEPLRFRASIVSYEAEAALSALSGDQAGWLERLWPLPESYRSAAGVQAAAAALSLSRSVEALDLLRTMWNDSAPEIRAARPAILRALKERGAPDLNEYLTVALASPDPALRSAALDRESGGANADPAATGREPRDYQRIARTLGHRVRLETSAGIMEIALDYRNAALTSENFVELVAAGRLDGQPFQDVTPGRDFTFEPSPAEAAAAPEPVWRPEINGQPFLRGSLGFEAAKGGSVVNRLFVCLTPQPLAGGRYTNFGRFVSGDDLLDAITVETRILKATVVE